MSEMGPNQDSKPEHPGLKAIPMCDESYWYQLLGLHHFPPYYWWL